MLLKKKLKSGKPILKRVEISEPIVYSDNTLIIRKIIVSDKPKIKEKSL